MSETMNFTVDGGIATLTIDLPGRSMNVVTEGFLTDLGSFVDSLCEDEKIRGAIITSGKESFVAGADLMWLVEIYDSGISADDLYEKNRQYSQLLRRMETCGKPVVAAINGTALGGGLELCLACHYRVAADNPRSVLGTPEVQVGLLPGAGGTQRLPRLMGIQPALELLTRGNHVSPARAKELGIVHAVVDSDDLMDAARGWLDDNPVAEQPWDRKGFRIPGGAGAFDPRAAQVFMGASAMIAKQTQHNYPAPIAIASSVYEGTILPFDKGLDIESKYFTSLMLDPVYRNLTRTLFINKGAAEKGARRPRGVEKQHVGKLGMLGSGMMGAGIAYVSARAGIDVVLLDTSKEAAEKGKDYSRQLLQKRIDKGRMDADKARDLLDRIETTTDYDDLKGCDLVIEAVFENRDIKADVTQKTEAVVGADTIFASNTSTLPITGLAKAWSKPENFVGLHFFSPVDKMPLVEIILGEKTGDEALALGLDYVRQIRKTPIVVNDSRGFYTSRVFGTYVMEAMALLKDGVVPALIENAGKQAGMAVGPLAVHDEVSLELSQKVQAQTKADLGDDYVAPAGSDVVDVMCGLGRKGKRFGKGFYEYPEGQRKFLWPGLAEHFPPTDEQPHVDEVKKRLLYIQSIETVRCLEEKVITDAADADLGSILGWGFPAWTGGTLSYIETVGLPEFVAEADRLAAAYGERFKVPALLREMATGGESFYGSRSADAARSVA